MPEQDKLSPVYTEQSVDKSFTAQLQVESNSSQVLLHLVQGFI
mgnify:CR=1 FL=1